MSSGAAARRCRCGKRRSSGPPVSSLRKRLRAPSSPACGERPTWRSRAGEGPGGSGAAPRPSPSPFGLASCPRHEALSPQGGERRRLTACSASYSALAPAARPPGRCAAASRRRGRLRGRPRPRSCRARRNSSASFCSEARIWSVARAAACDQHLLEDLLLRRPTACPTHGVPTIVSSDSVMWPVSMMCDCTS